MVLREVCFTNIFNLVILAFHPTWLELRRVFWTSQWLTRGCRMDRSSTYNYFGSIFDLRRPERRPLHSS